jgi:glucose/arabinose dehydrogenase
MPADESGECPLVTKAVGRIGALVAAGYVALMPVAIGCGSQLVDDVPTGPSDTVVVAGHKLYVPPGFSVNLFADGQDGVRFLALGPAGTVYATLSRSGKIVRLSDTNHDGVAESIVTVLSGLSNPSGIAFRGDTLYFAEQGAVKRLDPGATTPIFLTDLPSGPGHDTRTIAFGPDNLLYVAVGSSCNICDDSPPRAAVTRYNLDGSNAHTFATGLRNSVGLAFNPATGDLWANNNDRDNIGPNQRATDSLPPERLNILKDGKWYGWPQCYLPGKPNPEYAGADCSGVEPPALTVQAHSAPLGLAFYTGTMFPAEYHGDGFMTYHGSWNRSAPTGAKVVRVRAQSGQTVSAEDFVTGWQLSDGRRWGRPVAVLVAADGALLVSDDYAGRIWRVTFGH